MLTAKDASTKIPSGLKIVSCKDYGNHYLFTAFKDEREADPFYLVDKDFGIVRPFSIAGNAEMFYSMPEIDWR